MLSNPNALISRSCRCVRPPGTKKARENRRSRALVDDRRAVSSLRARRPADHQHRGGLGRALEACLRAVARHPDRHVHLSRACRRSQSRPPRAEGEGAQPRRCSAIRMVSALARIIPPMPVNCSPMKTNRMIVPSRTMRRGRRCRQRRDKFRQASRDWRIRKPKAMTTAPKDHPGHPVRAAGRGSRSARGNRAAVSRLVREEQHDRDLDHADVMPDRRSLRQPALGQCTIDPEAGQQFLRTIGTTNLLMR